ncbi:hypothetical protein [Acinetobacter ursingii]|uniref:hypothetical protein n=1 Tax=Acinetobacter ursingii TaxID=108980 RepID=UPI000666CFF3|nr:hypothetical protein [Acinetobacter ursingii]MCH2003900.1 hypothetical protein [Acinetobacter ursingii]MCU4380628.1 hypothetical protein [Acinetobacter ursingii]MCU4482573.1 hypothetical protein [Acinetobacter ursingii]MCU4506986.1 hypothetical protein [Acinetobacter ursingii]MCU4610066.1 hypothetical protein [Acinetobacter ursingii]
MNKKAFILLTTVAGLSLSGCQQMQDAANTTMGSVSKGIKAYDGWVSKGTQRVWDEMVNPAIRDKFLVLNQSQNGNNQIKLNPILVNDKFELKERNFNTIYLEKYVLQESNFDEANRRIRNGAYISEKDLAAKLFIEQALAQGHEVRVYKASVNADINQQLKQTITEFKGAQNNYGFDPVFVEFDKSGSPVAIMTRSWQTISAIGVASRIYTNIYFGQATMRWFENNFSNRYLENTLIRTIH